MNLSPKCEHCKFRAWNIIKQKGNNKKKKLGRKKSNKFLFWLIYTEITIKQKIRLLRIRICTCQFQGRAVDKAYFRTI